MSAEDLARHLSFFVPPGFLLMKQSEIDRIHNEAEARLIERDNARDEVRRLRRDLVLAHDHLFGGDTAMALSILTRTLRQT